MTDYSQAVTRNNWDKHGEHPSVLDFGAVGDGTTDDGPAFNIGIAAIIARGGGTLFIPGGRTYAVATPIAFPLGTAHVSLVGDGPSSRLLRTADLGANGVLNINDNCSYIRLQSFLLDGGTTTPVGLQYGSGTSSTLFNNDPMDSKLWHNSSIFVNANAPQLVTASVQTSSPVYAGCVNMVNTFAGGEIVTWSNSGGTLPAPFTTSTNYYVVNPTPNTFQLATTSGGTPVNITSAGTGSNYITETSSTGLPIQNIIIDDVTITHTAGYAVLLYSVTDQIRDVTINNCTLINNRPNLFGSSSSDLNYGSWTGGIHYQNAASGSNIHNLLVNGCVFRRNTGNCVWGHSYNLNSYHENIKITNCHFEDCGLDGTEMGVVSGGTVSGNTFRRIGYICTDDTSASVPKYLAGLNATAIDTSGLVTDVSYSDNTIITVNGGFMDLDGFTNGVVADNYCRLPIPGDVEYTQDSVSSLASNISYGVNCGNSAVSSLIGLNITISGNTFLNLGAGAIRLGGTQNAKVYGNNIQHPAGATYAPILLFNLSSSLKAVNCAISNNTINWNPGSASAAVLESTAYTSVSWASTDKNWVGGNHIFGNCYEFTKDTSSGSVLAVMMNNSMAATGTGNAANGASSSGTASGGLIYDGLSLTIPGIASGPGLTLSSGYINSAEGLETTSTASNAIQAPNGGLSGKYLIASDSLFFIAESAPAVSGSGQARIYFDSTAHQLMASLNNGAYTPIITGNIGGTSQIIFNNGSNLTGSSSLIFTSTSGVNVMTLTGSTGSGIVSPTFNSTASGSGSAFQTSNNKFIVDGQGNLSITQQMACGWTMFAGQSSAPTTPASGQAALYYDTALGALRYNLGGAGWVNVGSASITSSANQVIYNNGSALVGGSGLLWNGSILFAGGTSPTSGTGVNAYTFQSVCASTSVATAFQSPNCYIYGDGHITSNGSVSCAGLTCSSNGIGGGSYALWDGSAYGTVIQYTGGKYQGQFDQIVVGGQTLTGPASGGVIATQAYVTGLGYLTSSALTGYATQSWVTGQGYITNTYANSTNLNQSLATTSSPTFNLLTVGGLKTTGGIQTSSGSYGVSQGPAAYSTFIFSDGICTYAA